MFLLTAEAGYGTGGLGQCSLSSWCLQHTRACVEGTEGHVLSELAACCGLQLACGVSRRALQQHLNDIIAASLMSCLFVVLLVSLLLQLQGSVLNALRAVLRREGVGGLYRGIGAVAWGAG